MKKWDIIIIVSLLMISFLPYLCIKGLMQDNVNSVYAYITVDGAPYMEIPLTGQVKAKEYVLKSKHGSNTIVVENEGITMIEADCTDHVCEEFGTIKKPGEIIVCLPNQVYIEIRGTMSEISDNVEDIRAY